MNSNSNLPPGCSDSDIPGNRPIDVAYDRFMDEFGDDLKSLSDDEISRKFNAWYYDEPIILAKEEPDWEPDDVVTINNKDLEEFVNCPHCGLNHKVVIKLVV